MWSKDSRDGGGTLMTEEQPLGLHRFPVARTTRLYHLSIVPSVIIQRNFSNTDRKSWVLVI